jgi:hypothetical protein
VRRNSRLSKMGLPRTNSYSQNSLTYRRRQVRLPGNLAETISCNCRWAVGSHHQKCRSVFQRITRQKVMEGLQPLRNHTSVRECSVRMVLLT